MQNKKTILVSFILLMIIAGVFRFYLISDLPGGLFPDEAANGLDVNQIIDGNPQVFFERGNGREALFFVINIIIWIVLLGKLGFDTEPLPLHFNVVYGIDHVGPAYQIYQIPLVGLLVIFINWFLAKLVLREQRLFSYFFAVSGALVQAMLFLAALSLVLLNP